MVEVSKKLLKSKAFVDKFNQILKEGDPTTLTASSIRKQLEDFFGLERDSLKEQPWKTEINAMIDDYARTLDDNEANSSGENDEDEDENDDNSRDQKDGDMETEDDEQQRQQLSHTDDDGDQELEEEEAPPKQKEKKEPVEKGTSDTESTSTKAPPKKKKQSKSPPAATKQTAKKESTKPSADEETIKRLKNYIRRCGVAVIRQKELADCPTLKSQIRKLKSMLEDLGVEGRPTIDKCEKIKKQRELKAEIDSLDTENILPSTKRGLRSSALSNTKKKRRIVEDDSEDDDRDAPAPLDISFLGNQSEEDSD